MNNCKKIKYLFDEALCHELNKEQMRFLESHIRECPACRAEFEEANDMIHFMKNKVRRNPQEDFWDDYWERLLVRMENENLVPGITQKQKKPIFQFLYVSPRWALQAAVALILVVMGIFIGREIFPPTAPIDPVNGDRAPVLVSAFEPGTELFSRTHNFLERSKLILLAMTNFDPETEDIYVLNLPYQQQVSRELVQQAGGIKNELSGLDQRQLSELISDLEIILLQVANLESDQNRATIKMVKNGVKIRGVLFKIQLTDIRQSINKRKKSKSI